MDPKLPDKNTVTSNGLEVTLKALGGFILGLILVVWAVPGVPEVVTAYVRDNWLQVALTIGLPTAISTGLINSLFDWRKGMDLYTKK